MLPANHFSCKALVEVGTLAQRASTAANRSGSTRVSGSPARPAAELRNEATEVNGNWVCGPKPSKADRE